MKNKICVIIPAYNEEISLPKVIKQIRSSSKKSFILVVDDGSIDKTRSIAIALSDAVIPMPFNCGIGSAVKAGLEFARREEFSLALQIDADGQHPPKHISTLIEKMKTDSADLVIGSRYYQKTLYQGAISRTIGILIFSKIIEAVSKKRIHDATSGFRLFNRRAIEFLAEKYPEEFPEPESIVLLLRHGYKIDEVSVNMKPRQAGFSSVSLLKGAYFFYSNSISIISQRF